MSIKFSCPKCSKQYSLKEELAGKSAKCVKCGHRLKIPEPVAVDALADLTQDDDLGNWFEEELSQPSPARTSTSGGASSRPGSSKNCTACGNPLAEGAVMCVACGYDLRSGKKHVTKKVLDAPDSKGKVAAKQTASLARGALFSAIGAALGAVIWFVIYLLTNYQIGWIALGLGCASGAGMAMGHEDNDGTMAGIIAAGISILGIIGAKVLIFEHVKSQLADMGVTLEAVGALMGEEITLGSMFGPIDGLFILLAVASAYKIGSGQATD